jgi:hypothetical protein
MCKLKIMYIAGSGLYWRNGDKKENKIVTKNAITKGYLDTTFMDSILKPLSVNFCA